MDTKALLSQCDNPLGGHEQPRPIRERLVAIADQLCDGDFPDMYGEGSYLQGFEAEVAAMFGKQAAVFMPSGTMAQQIALRIWCDRSGNPTLAMHPTAHLETAEHLGYQHLLGLRRLQFGASETNRERLLEIADFEKLAILPGAALIEVPCRPLGGQLHAWDELCAISEWLRSREIPCHLDGARIWQCAAAYRKPLDEIAGLFDSLYVSFYKDIGALCGCMLLGDSDFIAEARVWQRRYGGNLFDQSPFYTSARQRMHAVLPQLPGWVARAQEIAQVFDSFDRARVSPAPPQVNFFRLYLEGDADALLQKHHALAAETGTFLFARLAPAAIPGFAWTEVHVWENAMRFDLDRLAPFLEQLLA